jgi:eukaryotic-like serine/threonine-protein kinase
MRPDRWARVQAAFEAALDRPVAEWSGLVDAAFPDDADLRFEVHRLLRAHAATGPLDRLATKLHETTPSPPPHHPVRIGVWRIEALIGRGGMGSVYMAERADGQYAQRAALKLLRQDVADPDLRRRFLAERRILARIEHPGIARILDGGMTEEGRPWFAMEYVEGLPIDVWCDSSGLGVRERLALFRDVCTAVQHAHAHLVVHRDIKPANIVVTAENRVVLLDFGIARLLDPAAFPDELDRTSTGNLLLTPAHASPEQLRGEPVHTASDVFQLGLLLFILLTGRTPRRRRGPDGAGEGVAERPSAVAPPALRRALDVDLDTIVRAATRTEPELRYPSVDRLSEDVQRWLDGLPIRARPDTVRYRASRFMRRHRVGVGLVAGLVLMLSGSAAVTLVQARRVEAERDRARLVVAFLADLFEAPGDASAGGILTASVQALEQATIDARRSGEDRAEAFRELASRLLAGSSALRRAQMARAATAGARILWVDDNPASNQYEILLFESMGAQVVTSTTTADAIGQIQAETWDLVLSDMTRQGRSGEGIALLDWMRDHHAPVPVVFYVLDADTGRDRPFGSFGLTNQPDELIHLVLDVLERRRP